MLIKLYPSDQEAVIRHYYSPQVCRWLGKKLRTLSLVSREWEGEGTGKKNRLA